MPRDLVFASWAFLTDHASISGNDLTQSSYNPTLATTRTVLLRAAASNNAWTKSTDAGIISFKTRYFPHDARIFEQRIMWQHVNAGLDYD